jgi:ankyrin repeat protein
MGDEMPDLSVDAAKLASDLNGAAHSGKVQLVRSLMAMGADVNGPTKLGTLPLHVAASAGRVDICKMLLQAGADVDAREFKGRTPLRWAAACGHSAVCAVLLEHGASPNLQCENGSTALHEAAVRSDIATCALLIDCGAHLTITNENNSTPVHSAVSSRSLALCRVLQEKCPGVFTARVGEDSTPFEYAVYTGASEIVSFLALECGASLGGVGCDGRSLEQIAGSNAKMIALLGALRTEVAVRSAFAGIEGEALAVPHPKAGMLSL